LNERGTIGHVHRARNAVLVLLLAGCATTSPRPAPATWWHGSWVVDGERLAAPEELAALPPSARGLAAQLARAAAPEHRYEFSADAVLLVRPGVRVTAAYAVVVADARQAELRASAPSGLGVLRIQRGPQGVVMSEGDQAPLPLRRAR